MNPSKLNHKFALLAIVVPTQYIFDSSHGSDRIRRV